MLQSQISGQLGVLYRCAVHETEQRKVHNSEIADDKPQH